MSRRRRRRMSMPRARPPEPRLVRGGGRGCRAADGAASRNRRTPPFRAAPGAAPPGAALIGGGWPAWPTRERPRTLQRASPLRGERAEELPHAESPDVGKPITFARVVDVNNAAELYEYYASLGHHLDGAV